MTDKNIKFQVIFNTNRPIWTFGQEMCAYVTGQVGYCFDDSDLAKMRDLARDEMDEGTVQWFDSNILNHPDYDNKDDLCPVSIYGTTEFGEPTAFDMFFKSMPPDSVIDTMVERTKKFASDRYVEPFYGKPLNVEWMKIIRVKEATEKEITF